MMNRARIALAAGLLWGVACHRDDTVAKLKALDEAYQSGVFTKEEYDAKRQALVGTPAAAPVATPAAPSVPAQTVEPPKPSPIFPDKPAASGVPRSAIAPPPVSPPAPGVPTPATPPVQPPAETKPSEPKAVEPAAAAEHEDEPAPLAGCHDTNPRPGGAGVREQFYPASVDAVRKAATLALENLDFTIHKDSKNQIEASKRRHLSAIVGAGGERLILHFDSVQQGGQSGTRVTGETKKSLVGRLAQKSWTGAVLAQIGCNLRVGKR